MLDYSSIKPRKRIIVDGEPYEVLDAHVFRKQQRKPVNQTKLKNMITGKVVERSFHQSETVEEADIDKKNIQYLYNKPARGAQAEREWWFCDPNDPSDRFEIGESVIGETANWMKENMEVEGLVFDDAIIGVTVPIKMEFEVTEAPPNIKGNTASGGDKKVTLETGAVIVTPMFVETGDVIEVNTETGTYVKRVE